MGMEWKQVPIGKYQKEEVFKEEAGARVLRREGESVVLRCAFCRGKGIGYSGGGTCFVCGGNGETTLCEPIRECVFCGGSGRGERSTDTSCVVCRGKGAMSVIEPYERCPDCKGKGMRANQRIPCHTCSGRGIVPGKG